MNKFYIYTIFRRIEDLVKNPEWEQAHEDLARALEHLDQEGAVIDAIQEKLASGDIPEYIIDPNNASGVRYVPIKIVHDIGVAQDVCRDESGEYVYSHSDAYYGENF